MYNNNFVNALRDPCLWNYSLVRKVCGKFDIRTKAAHVFCTANSWICITPYQRGVQWLMVKVVNLDYDHIPYTGATFDSKCNEFVLKKSILQYHLYYFYHFVSISLLHSILLLRWLIAFTQICRCPLFRSIVTTDMTVVKGSCNVNWR